MAVQLTFELVVCHTLAIKKKERNYRLPTVTILKEPENSDNKALWLLHACGDTSGVLDN